MLLRDNAQNWNLVERFQRGKGGGRRWKRGGDEEKETFPIACWPELPHHTAQDGYHPPLAERSLFIATCTSKFLILSQADSQSSPGHLLAPTAAWALFSLHLGFPGQNLLSCSAWALGLHEPQTFLPQGLRTELPPQPSLPNFLLLYFETVSLSH